MFVFHSVLFRHSIFDSPYTIYVLETMFPTSGSGPSYTVPKIRGSLLNPKHILLAITWTVGLPLCGWRQYHGRIGRPPLRGLLAHLTTVAGLSPLTEPNIGDGLPVSQKSEADILQKETMLRNKTHSRLFALPDELLLIIMNFLQDDAHSLYLFRQASTRFFRLFEDREFSAWHQKSPGTLWRVEFAVDKMSPFERDWAAKHLRRDYDYCDECTKHHDGGHLENRLENLGRDVFCTGCQTHHAGVFFSPLEMEEDETRTVSRLVCLGRTGHLTLCSHDSSPRVTWANLERIMSGPGDKGPLVLPASHWELPWTWESVARWQEKNVRLKELFFACTNLSHLPCGPRKNYISGSPFPRFIVLSQVSEYRDRETDSITEIPKARLQLAWDVPLLDIGTVMAPTVEAVREAVREAVQKALSTANGALRQQKHCGHLSLDRQLRDFVYSGICECFTRAGNTVCPPNRKTRTELQVECECNPVRDVYLECPVCGAVYSWFLAAGRVFLAYRYRWDMFGPASPAWLGLLDASSCRDQVMSESNKHVLWCDTPGCGTRRGHRWERLMKTELSRRQTTGLHTDMSRTDCSIMYSRSRDKQYWMPWNSNGDR